MTDHARATRVLVLAGGPDAEHDVSLMSAASVAAALRQHDRFEVHEHVIASRLTAEALRALPGDVVFPALHGPWGEGGPLQVLLESDGRPYVGSGPEAAAIAMDKVASKRIAIEIGIATPEFIEAVDEDSVRAFAPPAVLKPARDGSSVDVVIARDEATLIAAWREMSARRSNLMLERFIPGRELTVGVIGGEVRSLIEICPAVEFYDYEAKYTRDDTRYEVSPNLPGGVSAGMRRDALALFEAMNCRDLARIDFRLDDISDPEQPSWSMLEINTMPGFTAHSLVPMGEVAGGVTMEQLCERLIDLALARSTHRRLGTADVRR